jgi:hypothetical protein
MSVLAEIYIKIFLRGKTEANLSGREVPGAYVHVPKKWSGHRYRRFGVSYCPHLHHCLKMETVCSFETSVTIYKAAQCHNPEDHNLKHETNIELY